jgi:hypothetical protein
MRIGRGNRSTRRKPAPVPLCPPQIPHDLTRARTRAAAGGSRQLTAWATARPIPGDTKVLYYWQEGAVMPCTDTDLRGSASCKLCAPASRCIAYKYCGVSPKSRIIERPLLDNCSVATNPAPLSGRQLNTFTRQRVYNRPLHRNANQDLRSSRGNEKTSYHCIENGTLEQGVS